MAVDRTRNAPAPGLAQPPARRAFVLAPLAAAATMAVDARAHTDTRATASLADSTPPLAFHAAGPGWFNDPNGLVHAGGRWRLFVQHRADKPAFRECGWARLSSDDLLHWDWDGPVLPPAPARWAYSGCVEPAAGAAGLHALHTVHVEHAGHAQQHQQAMTSADAGSTWQPGPGAEGLPQGRNVRDPFVFGGPNAQRLAVLARPCDWTGWAADPPSALSLHAWHGDRWHGAGRIGPWSAPGVMWEVPWLAALAPGRWLLVISQIDRRGGGAECIVRAWIGRLDRSGGAFAFVPDAVGERKDEAAWPMDLGPDFYAAMVSATPWRGVPLVVGWAASWATARGIAWPGGLHGGPITLPRLLQWNPALQRPRLAPLPTALPLAHTVLQLDGSAGFAIGHAAASIEFVPDAEGGVTVRRSSTDTAFDWQRHHRGVLTAASARVVTVFIDGPLVEAFIEPEGLALTAVLPPGAAPGHSWSVRRRAPDRVGTRPLR